MIIRPLPLRYWIPALLLFFTPLQAVAASQSIYDLPVQLTDQDGKPFSLDLLKGRQVVVTMAYTSCKSACPLTMQRLIKLEQELARAKKKADFVIVTLDPEHDGPKQLKKYQRGYKLEKPNWHLATGSPIEVRKLSLLLGISYRAGGEGGEIMHTNKLLLLNGDGAIISEVEGLNGDVTEIADQAQ